jgi:hypothetical protein
VVHGAASKASGGAGAAQNEAKERAQMSKAAAASPADEEARAAVSPG